MADWRLLVSQAFLAHHTVQCDQHCTLEAIPIPAQPVSQPCWQRLSMTWRAYSLWRVETSEELHATHKHRHRPVHFLKIHRLWAWSFYPCNSWDEYLLSMACGSHCRLIVSAVISTFRTLPKKSVIRTCLGSRWKRSVRCPGVDTQRLLGQTRNWK